MRRCLAVTAAIMLGWNGLAPAADFNGDGLDDIGIFRASSGLWSVRGITRVYFGGSGDVPVPGVFNIFGRDDIAIYRPSNGLWWVKDVTRVYYGSGSDLPIGPAGGRWLPRGDALCYTGGRVAIGTAAPDPADLLTVNGGRSYFVNSIYHGVEISDSAWSALYIHDTPYSGIDIDNCGQNFIRAGFSDIGTSFTVQSTGRVGIGTAPDPTAKLSVNGDVVIAGNLTKGGGAFRIDHPLDPTDRYLSHSFVESPDMMNVYNGNAVLDEKGEAVVNLPAYFEALNRDFRYQLTCLGSFAPVYVAEEIAGNKFRIAGGTPGLKISWQVTGVRQDPYALKNPIVVEEEKPKGERGSYLHPGAYGQPEPKAVAGARTEQPAAE